jgi:hypothetical protein
MFISYRRKAEPLEGMFIPRSRITESGRITDPVGKKPTMVSGILETVNLIKETMA